MTTIMTPALADACILRMDFWLLEGELNRFSRELDVAIALTPPPLERTMEDIVREYEESII